ncbi:hypothetical protein M2323_000768 [Rhodoblastus acidophilus]|uniref:hypothetical protein n=1 Tax=Rhodoblastus acidophilus TaxID=1074 RepID=UPI002224C8E6|nr:hypothetical protein [Rhodoblastus acidophilus]MCW2283085.1 hypothetical protein [Rhodoblastus acidophilus]MCW2331864.1 hypothetical protein [Rhodoblastus acidophilus]
MRRLGERPLTGAQKQKRHRERLKARLAEADSLKAREQAVGGDILAVIAFYRDLLRELGASAQEAEQIAGGPGFQDDIVALLRLRGQAALDALRRPPPSAGTSLLARLQGAR